MLNFNEQMNKLKEVKGYLGAAILNKEGETLYLDDKGTKSDIVYSASVFHDAFLSISESSLDIGFASTKTMEAQTNDGYVFLIKSIVDKEKNHHLTFFTIFNEIGDVPFAKDVMSHIKNLQREEAFS